MLDRRITSRGIISRHPHQRCSSIPASPTLLCLHPRPPQQPVTHWLLSLYAALLARSAITRYNPSSSTLGPFCHAASLATAPSWIEQTPSDWNFRPPFAPSTKAAQKIAEHLIKQNIVSPSFQITNRRSVNLLPYLLKWKYQVDHYLNLLQFLYIKKKKKKGNWKFHR